MWVACTHLFKVGDPDHRLVSKSAKVTQDAQTAQVTRKSAHFPIKWAVLIYWAVLLLGSSSFSHGGFNL